MLVPLGLKSFDGRHGDIEPVPPADEFFERTATEKYSDASGQCSKVRRIQRCCCGVLAQFFVSC